MVVMKKCRKCQLFKEMNDENFGRSPASARSKCTWLANCKRCHVVAPPKSRTEAEEAHDREARIRREAEREVVLLIRRYEAVRFAPGPGRNAAYNALAVALQRHGRVVSDGAREWEWNRAMGEITTRLLERKWQPPEDRHADPRRMARDEMRAAEIDLIEII